MLSHLFKLYIVQIPARSTAGDSSLVDSLWPLLGGDSEAGRPGVSTENSEGCLQGRPARQGDTVSASGPTVPALPLETGLQHS